ncbi:keratin-associated protein 8-1 [Pan paniscus]|uniref:keratin-associated protein 8-1 n=1 Tax=Pan paniscus TaxID=9597 RepID=UPI001560151D
MTHSEAALELCVWEQNSLRDRICLRKRTLLLPKPSTPDTILCDNFPGAVFPGCYWGSYGYPLGYSVGCGYGSTYSPVGYGFGYGYNGCGAFGYRRYSPFALY